MQFNCKPCHQHCSFPSTGLHLLYHVSIYLNTVRVSKINIVHAIKNYIHSCHVIVFMKSKNFIPAISVPLVLSLSEAFIFGRGNKEIIKGKFPTEKYCMTL